MANIIIRLVSTVDDGVGTATEVFDIDVFKTVAVSALVVVIVYARTLY